MKNSQEKEEKNAEKSVELAQIFEFAIMVILLNQLEVVLTNDTRKQRSESLETIRNQTKKEIDVFIPLLLKESLETLKTSNKQLYDEIPKGMVVPPPNNKWHKQIEEEFKKYIKSKGLVLNGQPLEEFFTNLCDKQVKKIVEGSTTLQNAMKESCHIMAQNGVSIVTYPQPNGHAINRNIDVYVRQQLLYAQKESTQDTRYKIAEENNVTVFEIDAHADSRPSHQYWQGRRFDTTGKIYPTFEELSNGHGGLDDYGCLHRAYPVFNPKSKPAYTLNELNNINTKPFTYGGIKYTGYEAKQRMRAYERGIRALKREKMLMEEKGLKSKILDNKLANELNAYKSFCNAYGNYPRNDRIRVVNK